jgi:hypothetical protein
MERREGDCSCNDARSPISILYLKGVSGGDMSEALVSVAFSCLSGVTAVRFDELLTADEHAARSAAGIVDTSLISGQHLHEHADHPRRCIELSALLPFSDGELGQEVLVDAAENVFGPIRGTAQSDVVQNVLRKILP